MTYALPKIGLTTTAPLAPKPPLTRAERIAIGVYALEHHANFAPGVHGFERQQAAESIVRVVIDALDAAK
jgi:hypothetical protein